MSVYSTAELVSPVSPPSPLVPGRLRRSLLVVILGVHEGEHGLSFQENFDAGDLCPVHRCALWLRESAVARAAGGTLGWNGEHRGGCVVRASRIRADLGRALRLSGSARRGKAGIRQGEPLRDRGIFRTAPRRRS